MLLATLLSTPYLVRPSQGEDHAHDRPAGAARRPPDHDDARHRAGRVRDGRRPAAGHARRAHAWRRRGARARAGRRPRPRHVAPHDRPAAHGPPHVRPAHPQAPGPRPRPRRHGRVRGRGRHALLPRRRGLRHRRRLVRRVRRRQGGQARPQAGEPHVRAGRGGSRLRAHRPAGRARHRPGAARAARARHRRVRRRRHLRGAGRHGPRCRGDRRVQHVEGSTSSARWAPPTSSTTPRSTSPTVASTGT